MTKKLFNWTLAVALVAGLSLTVTSCKDDDDNKDNGTTEAAIKLSVDQELAKNGIITDVHSAAIKVPVKCDGGWAAWIVDDVDWLRVDGRQVFFEGDQTLRIVFDENHDGHDRFTTLRLITDDGQMTDIKVTQTQLWNGEAPNNSSAQWFGNNGLGRGLNFQYMFEGDSAENHKLRFKPESMTMTNPIFNWANIIELQGQRGADGKPLLSADAYVENTLENINFDDVMHDSIIHGKDSIGVKFDLSISFGFVEFEGHGEYHAKESKDNVHMNYLISRSATVYEVFTSPAELAMKANELGGESELSAEELDAQEAKILKQEANYKRQNQMKYKRKKDATPEQLDPDYLEPWQEEAIAKAYDQLGMPTYAGIFSSSFGRLYFRLNRYVQMGNDDKVEAALEKLDSDYGPLFVGRGWYGGSINVRITVDKDSIDTDGHFTGALAGGVGNLFHIEGEVTYQEETTYFVRNSDAKISVYGGEGEACANALSAHFNSTSATNRQNLLTILENWGRSLKETKDDNGKSVPSKAALENMQLVGIWTLFDDDDVAKVVRDYMYAKHPSLNNLVGHIM